MQNLGFGIFGRPVGHEYISNGLFKSLHLEGQTYLDPLEVGVLNKGERLVQISRQNINNIEIIKIYIFDYAKSFNNRGGGFVGSAYVFTGRPTKKLFDYINFLHKKAADLLNTKLQFVSDKLNISENNLESPQTSGFIEGSAIRVTTSSFTKDKMAIYTEGPVLNHLISVVQGFMFNPNFSKLETIYVSDNKALLKRIPNMESKNILGIGHVLNFQNRFDSLNRKLNQKRNELKEFNSKFNDHKEKEKKYLQDSLNKLNTEIKEKNSAYSKINREIIEKQNNEQSLNKSIEGLKKTQNNFSKKIEELQYKQNELNQKINENFNRLVNNPKFRNEKVKLINQSRVVYDLKNEIAELKAENDSLQPKFKMHHKLLLFGGIILFFSIFSFLIGHYHLFGKLKDQLAGETYTEETAKPSQVNNMNDAILESNDTSIVHEISSDKEDDIEPNDFFLAPIDTLEFDNHDPVKGMEQFEHHFNQYRNGAYSEIDDIEWVNSKFIEAILKAKYGTESGHDILDEYINYHKNDNIYTRLNINHTSKAAYMYFRWMVWELNDSIDIVNHQFNSGDKIKVYIIE